MSRAWRGRGAVTLVGGSLLVMLTGAAPGAREVNEPPPAGGPLSIETVGVEPTVAMTGDVLTATYRLRFEDLIARGKEVVILEDRIAPDKLSLAPFEAVGLEVEKRQAGPLHMWELRYRMRIVGQKKDVVVLPGFTCFYLVRDLGQKIEDARVLQMDTQPLSVRYVTTVTDDPVLDIRDRVELERFAGRVAVLRGLAWLIAPLPLLLWTVSAVRARRPVAERRSGRLEPPPDDIPATPQRLSAAQARRMLIDRLRTSAIPGSRHSPSGEDQRHLLIWLREYLLAEVPSLNPGDTAKEIRRHIEALTGPPRRQDVLTQLASSLVRYQSALERVEPAALDTPADALEIERLVRSLTWRGRWLRWPGASRAS